MIHCGMRRGRCCARTTLPAGAALSYADLSAFQLVEGLDGAFLKALARLAPHLPLVVALRAPRWPPAAGRRPRIAAWLQSGRRRGFSQVETFRRYPELDAGREAAQTCANPT